MEKQYSVIPKGPRRLGGRFERRDRSGRDFKRGDYKYRDDKYRDDRSRDDRRNYHRTSRRNDDSRYETSIAKPKRIDPRPSGILVKYADFQRAPSSQKLTVIDTLNKYTPPEDEIIPTKENCNYHLFKYNEDTEKQIEIPLYNFKSFFIFGRDKELSDIVIDEETEDGDLVSKQHAALQFRKNKDSDNSVTCYIIDLGSTNGIFLNGSEVELPKKRYIQLKNKDYFKLGDYDSILEFTVIQDI